MGVAVALDYLGRNRRWFQIEASTDVLLDLRADVGEGSNRAGDLAHAQIFGGGFEACKIAAGFFIPDGEFEPEGDRYARSGRCP